jgi:hypothetical protein
MRFQEVFGIIFVVTYQFLKTEHNTWELLRA